MLTKPYFYFQTQTKSMKEMMERLKEENNQLNKRRLIEGSGFRNEVKLLKDQLDRTQRQLCFLTLRKCEGWIILAAFPHYIYFFYNSFRMWLFKKFLKR